MKHAKLVFIGLLAIFLSSCTVSTSSEFLVKDLENIPTHHNPTGYVVIVRK